MLFKLIATLKPMHLDEGFDPVEFSLTRNGENIVLEIETIPDEQRQTYHELGDCFCSATVSRALPEKMIGLIENVQTSCPEQLSTYLVTCGQSYLMPLTCQFGSFYGNVAYLRRTIQLDFAGQLPGRRMGLLGKPHLTTSVLKSNGAFPGRTWIRKKKAKFRAY